MKLRILAPFFGLALAAAAAADDGARAHLTILSTTDLHGHIYPVDYFTNRPDPVGLAKTATLIAAERRQAPEALLLDSGDTIQGSPLEYYHNRLDESAPDPLIAAMNALHYDAMAVGNHDYNFGLAVQGKARGEARFPWLSANTYKAGTAETAFQPYIIREIDGVRVGVLGLTTPAIPTWENVPNYAGLEFHPAVSEAKKWVGLLRGREHVDVVIVAMHMGLERNLATGRPTPFQAPHENAAVAIAEQVPGIDLILMGHTHQDVPAIVIHGVLLTQADLWGRYLARADLYLARPAGGSWSIWAKSAKTIPVMADTPADPAILRLDQAQEDATEKWLDRPIGQSAADLSAADAAVRSNAIIDLIQRVQLEAGSADVSLAAPFNLSARIRRGPVTVRDIYSFYVYENTLVVVQATGAMLKAALEHSAEHFLPYVAGKTVAQLINPRVWTYNFDVAAGVDYEIDLARPAGDRIRNLRYHGAPLAPDQKLRLAVNNYRVNGGGGYTMLHDAPVLQRSSEEIRDLIIAWMERHHDIPTQPMNNWRVTVPRP